MSLFFEGGRGASKSQLLLRSASKTHALGLNSQRGELLASRSVAYAGCQLG